MTYASFLKTVRAAGYTVVTLRCDDAPPTAELLDLMSECGLAKYERFVLKYEREQGAK